MRSRKTVRAGAEIWVTFCDYFLTSQKCSGSFWSAAVTYSLTFSSCPSGFWDKQSSGARTFLADSRHGNLNFRRVIHFRFRSVFYFGRISTSSIAAELRPPRVRDLRTMEQVDSTRLTSLEHVTRAHGNLGSDFERS